MSKKSKKILAYLMFVAALCGTPAVSEARGSSGGQVKTEKASTAQRGNFSQSFISYILRNYGPEVAKAIFYGGGSFGAAKFLKAGDLSTWASYLFDMKNADLKKAEKLIEQYNTQKAVFDKEKKDFISQRAKALKDNEKLINDKNVLELKNNNLNAEVKENKQKIKELENSKAKLSNEVLSLKDHNYQLLNITNEDNRKIDALLSGLLPYKMSGEFAGSYADNSWKTYKLNNLEAYSNSQDVVTVAFVNYVPDLNMNFNMIGKAEELKLGTGSFLDEIEKKAKELLGQDATDILIALKDVDLSYFSIPRLARCSFILKDENEDVKKVVAAYFPVKSFQEKNNVENNENNENANENIQNNENNNENNDENVQNNENENDINIDDNNMNNEINANENNNINGENNENNDN